MRNLIVSAALFLFALGLMIVPRAHATGNNNVSFEQWAQPVGWASVPRWETYPYTPYGYGAPYYGYSPYDYGYRNYGYYGYPHRRYYDNPYGYGYRGRYYRYYEGPINPWRYNNRSLNPDRYVRPPR